MAFKKFWRENIIAINKQSLLLIVLPYIGFNWQELVQSPFFSYSKLIYLILIVFGVELLFKALQLYKSNYTIYISILISSFLIIFFYGNYLVDPVFNLLNKNWGIIIRGKTIILASLIIVTLIQVMNVKRSNLSYKYFNIFLIIFSIVTFALKHNPNKIFDNKNNSTIYTNKYEYIKSNSDTSKPLIFIITDEYSSPDNLYSLTKNSSLYQYSNDLSKSGWLVKNHFYSYEISSIHSLGSILNFNLSNNKSFKYADMTHVGYNQLIHSRLIDSLDRKGVDFINFGIFDIKDQKAYSTLYIYPKNFTEHFLLYSCYLLAKRSSISFHGKKLNGKNEIIMEHNKYFIYNLDNEIKKIKPRTFVYVHLFMPHAPLQFEPEFKRKELKNLNDYLEYWKFSNKKLSVFLKSLTVQNKYRIIVTGDHGLRGMPTDPNYTFSAFYGFDSLSVDKIKSVQDLGSFINCSF